MVRFIQIKPLRRHLLVIIILLSTSYCFATGQEGELVIYRGDTLTMLSEPLEIYLLRNEPRENLHPSLNSLCSTALWRGYQGLWEIRDNRLLLIDVFACGDKSQSIIGAIFKGYNSEIYADWFSGKLFIEKGRVIKYNHSGFDRYYEFEIVVNVNDGIIESQSEYKNGIRPNDNGFSRDPIEIATEIYKRIDWDNLPKLPNDKRAFILIEIDKQGKIKDSKIYKEIEKEYQNEIERIIKEFPVVQIFYSKGQPLKETWIVPIRLKRPEQ